MQRLFPEEDKNPTEQPLYRILSECENWKVVMNYYLSYFEVSITSSTDFFCNNQMSYGKLIYSKKLHGEHAWKQYNKETVN